MNHLLLERSLEPPFPSRFEVGYFAMGCFWGAEQLFWSEKGIYVTAVGYSGGHLESPTYPAVCKGKTGHAETVKVVFDPTLIQYTQLLKIFWESHNPTQGMRQGNDIGEQYRSTIFCNKKTHHQLAMKSKIQYQKELDAHQTSTATTPITTEILPLDKFWYAEAEHQQYLFRNPNGYCGLKGTGISCSI